MLDAGDAPDGDADLEGRDFSRFDVPACPACGGILKPDVVFFGENVPRHRVDAAVTSLNEADAMLVVGSSLMVFSGYRFAAAAAREGKPIAAVNLGKTRADPLLQPEDRTIVRPGLVLRVIKARRTAPRALLPFDAE